MTVQVCALRSLKKNEIRVVSPHFLFTMHIFYINTFYSMHTSAMLAVTQYVYLIPTTKAVGPIPDPDKD